MAASSPLEPPFTISLAGRVGHLFDPQTMMQGFVCHGRGVELLAASPTHIAARVKGKRTHDVALAIAPGALAVTCSCPARSYGQSYCKHLWAALLEIDRRGGFETLRTTRAPLGVVAASAEAAVDPKKSVSTAKKKAAAKKSAKAAKATKRQG